MLAYKLVEKNTRWCLNVANLKYRGHDISFCRKHPEYFPKYFKGSTVEAVSGSPGIMCFENPFYAENFLNHINNLKIIKVEGINPLNFLIVRIKTGVWFSPEHILDEGFNGYAPNGTITFEKVKVLE